MPNHDDELKRFFNTPPEDDAEFELAFEMFAQKTEFEEVIRDKARWQKKYFELLERYNQPHEANSPAPDGLPFLAFYVEGGKRASASQGHYQTRP